MLLEFSLVSSEVFKRVIPLLKAWSIRWLVGLLGCCWFSCASQAPPLPPRVQIPQAVVTLKALQIGHEVELSWTLPEFAVDGERLTRPLETSIFRYFVPLGESVSDPLPFETPRIRLLSSDLKALSQDGVIRLKDSLEPQEVAEASAGVYLYAVRSLVRGKRRESKISNLVSIRFFPVSGPIEGLSVELQEDLIRLTWNWGHLSAEASRYFREFAVFRSKEIPMSSKIRGFRFLGKTQEPEYLDSNFEYDQMFHYKVYAIFGEGDFLSRSKDSESVSITPQDSYPPRAPVGLGGLYSKKSMDLIWKANHERDLAGYYIYRRKGPQLPQQVNQELLIVPLYKDSDVELGERYTYNVTAVDREGNESEPSEEIAIEAH